MITIIPFDKTEAIEMFDNDRFEIIETYEDGTILVEDLDTGETRHLRQVSVQ